MGALLNQRPFTKCQNSILILQKFVSATEARSSLHIKGFASACFLADYACSLLSEVSYVRHNHVSDELAVLSRAFHLWWKRCSTTITCFNNYFLGIEEFQINSASGGCGGFLLDVCFFIGPLQGDPVGEHG